MVKVWLGAGTQVGALLFLLCGTASGAVFNIANGDVAGLISAINTANTNSQSDVINLASGGTYTLTAVNNTSSNGPNGLPVIQHESFNFGTDLVIHGNGATLQRSTAGGTPAFALFEISALVSMDNLTIQNGSRPNSGGAIYLAGTSLNSRLILTKCALNNNSATSNSLPGPSGGAIYNPQNTPITITSCTFDTCATSGDGGAIANFGNGTVTLNFTSFHACSAGFHGGVLCTTSGSTATVNATRCTFDSNSAQGVGGALAALGGGTTFNLNSSTFTSNHSAGAGGAIYGATFNAIAANITAINCTFFQNSATFDDSISLPAANGGAIYNQGMLTLTNCTLLANFEYLCNGSGCATASDGIVNARNMAAGNTIFASSPVSSAAAGFTSQGHNLADDAEGGDSGTAPGGLLNAAGDMRNTNSGLLSSPQNNGGATQTVALFFTSAAVDHGDGSLAPRRDERGYFRTGPPDIGAYENAGGLVGNSSISRSGNDVVVSVELVYGQTYELQRKNNMTDSTWGTISGVADLTATGNDTESFTAPGDFLLGKAFYHVAWQN